MWATPEVPSTSSMEPTRTHSMLTAVGARGSGLTSTVRPLDRANSCTLLAMGLAAEAAGATAAAGDGVCVWACTAALAHRAASSNGRQEVEVRARFIESCDSKNGPNVQLFQEKTRTNT